MVMAYKSLQVSALPFQQNKKGTMIMFQTVAAQPADGLGDFLKIGAGIAQALMQIISNKVQFFARLLSDKVMVTHGAHVTHLSYSQ